MKKELIRSPSVVELATSSTLLQSSPPMRQRMSSPNRPLEVATRRTSILGVEEREMCTRISMADIALPSLKALLTLITRASVTKSSIYFIWTKTRRTRLCRSEHLETLREAMNDIPGRNDSCALTSNVTRTDA